MMILRILGHFSNFINIYFYKYLYNIRGGGSASFKTSRPRSGFFNKVFNRIFCSSSFFVFILTYCFIFLQHFWFCLTFLFCSFLLFLSFWSRLWFPARLFSFFLLREITFLTGIILIGVFVFYTD